MQDKYYTLKEISVMLIISITYLRKLIKEKKLKGCFIGRQYIVRKQDLKNFISKLGVKMRTKLSNKEINELLEDLV